MTLKAVAITGGGGGGGVSGGGTPGTLPIWSGATALGNSPLSFSGATLSSSAAMTGINFSAAAGGQTWTLPNNGFALTIQGTSGNGTLKLDTNNRYVGIDSPSTPADKLHIAESGPLAFRMQNVTAATYWQHKVDGSGNWGLAVNGGTDALTALAAKVIASLTLTNGGAGYTNGSYQQVALTGGSGTGATADIVVSGGIVTMLVLRSSGQGYVVGDTLSCASIGAGAGFVATVAAVGSQILGDGTLAASRVGAGTQTPVSALHANGLLTASANEEAVLQGSTVNFRFRGQALFTSQYLTNGINKPAAGSAATNLQFAATQRIDTTLLSGSATSIGGYFLNTLFDCVSSSIFHWGTQSQAVVANTALTGKTVNSVTGAYGLGSVANVGATNVASLIVGVRAVSQVTSSTAAVSVTAMSASEAALATNGSAHTITDAHCVDATFSHAAGSVTNFYGARLRAPTGAGTITNRFGISQEDTLATNQFSATTNTFSGIVRATGSSALTPAFSTPTDTNTGMYFPFGDTIRFATNGSPAVSITSTKELQFDSGYGSVATAYGTRAWVNFNGTGTVAIRASGNVSSITDGGAGDYTVNMTNAMPDANYSVVFGCVTKSATDGTTFINIASDTAPTTTAVRIRTNDTVSFADRDRVNVSINR